MAPVDLEHAAGPQDPFAVFPSIQSSHGTFDFTSVGRDQSDVDSSHHITNTNTGNSTTTTTTNSGNELSVVGLSTGKQYFTMLLNYSG